MQRITITVDDELAAALDHVVTANGYQNRSEAIRDLTRAGIAQLQEQSNTLQSGVAALVYVYDHQERDDHRYDRSIDEEFGHGSPLSVEASTSERLLDVALKRLGSHRDSRLEVLLAFDGHTVTGL